MTPTLTEFQRKLIVATQGGLPLVSKPYLALAEQLDTTAEVVMQELESLLLSGVIRRIGAVPNHYAIGWTANGMTVWDVADEVIDEMGALIGTLPFVTHCYRRPRSMPAWPYNLFAMVHGSSRDECAAKADEIRQLLGAHCAASDILYSSKILKKTGVRLIP